MKFAILPVIVFLAVMVFASAKKHDQQLQKEFEITGEWKGSYSMQDGPLVNDIFFEFVKGQLQVFDGSKSWGDEATGKRSQKSKLKSQKRSPICLAGHWGF